jgi:hypothetical protein
MHVRTHIVFDLSKYRLAASNLQFIETTILPLRDLRLRVSRHSSQKLGWSPSVNKQTQFIRPSPNTSNRLAFNRHRANKHKRDDFILLGVQYIHLSAFLSPHWILNTQFWPLCTHRLANKIEILWALFWENLTLPVRFRCLARLVVLYN